MYYISRSTPPSDGLVGPLSKLRFPSVRRLIPQPAPVAVQGRDFLGIVLSKRREKSAHFQNLETAGGTEGREDAGSHQVPDWRRIDAMGRRGCA